MLNMRSVVWILLPTLASAGFLVKSKDDTSLCDGLAIDFNENLGVTSGSNELNDCANLMGSVDFFLGIGVAAIGLASGPIGLVATVAHGLIGLSGAMDCKDNEGRDLLEKMRELAQDVYDTSQFELVTNSYNALVSNLSVHMKVKHLSLDEAAGYARDAQALEIQAAHLGLKGTPLVYAAATLKLYLIGAIRVTAMKAGNTACQKQAEFFIHNWTKESSNHIAALEDDLRAYHGSAISKIILRDLTYAVHQSSNVCGKKLRRMGRYGGVYDTDYHKDISAYLNGPRNLNLRGRTCCCAGTERNSYDIDGSKGKELARGDLMKKCNDFFFDLQRNFFGSNEAKEFKKCLKDIYSCTPKSVPSAHDE